MHRRGRANEPVEQKAVPFGAVEINLPSNWEDRSVFVFAEDRGGLQFESNFSVSRIPQDEPQPLRNLVKEHKLEGLDCLLVLSRDYREDHGREIFERIYRFVEPREGAIVQQAQRFIKHGTDLIVMTLSAQVAEFDAAYLAFNSAGQSIAQAEGN